MEALGKRGIPAGCRGGGCGVCKVRIEAGRYHTAKMSRACLSEAEDRGVAAALPGQAAGAAGAAGRGARTVEQAAIKQQRKRQRKQQRKRQRKRQRKWQ
ncbi:2Fe-2S iron-sulfur cluster-binding protein [Cupriavidus basilensis]|nr:2Fe-2S iron-sulfur cluster-binding protein [Cupriavidus basilensis]